jgi:hypothetical protein
MSAAAASSAPKIKSHRTANGHIWYYVEGLGWQADPSAESKDAYWRMRKELESEPMGPFLAFQAMPWLGAYPSDRFYFAATQTINGIAMTRTVRREDIIGDPDHGAAEDDISLATIGEIAQGIEQSGLVDGDSF